MLSSPLRDSLPDTAINSGGSRPPWPTLLIVDSNAEMARTVVCFFERRGFHVAAARTLAEAKDFFHRRSAWTLVLSDCHLPDGTGWDLSGWMQDQGIATPFLLMSDSPQCATLCAGTEYLAKPFPLEKLEAYVRAM